MSQPQLKNTIKPKKMIAANIAASVIATVFHFRETSEGSFSSADAVGAAALIATGIGVSVTSCRSSGAAMSLLEILGIVDTGAVSRLLQTGLAELTHLLLSGGRKEEVLRIANVDEVPMPVAEVVVETIAECDELFEAVQ
jgi:hypothetical protein